MNFRLTKNCKSRLHLPVLLTTLKTCQKFYCFSMGYKGACKICLVGIAVSPTFALPKTVRSALVKRTAKEQREDGPFVYLITVG